MNVKIALACSLLVLLTACSGPTETTTTRETTPAGSAESESSAPDATTAPASTAETSTAGGEMAAVPPAAGGGGIQVKMGSDSGQLVYVPANLTVKPGDKITWIMNKAGPHNVVFDGAKSPDAAAAKAMTQQKLLNKAGDTLVTLVPANAKPGAYPFNCSPHKSAGMVGVLTVQ